MKKLALIFLIIFTIVGFKINFTLAATAPAADCTGLLNSGSGCYQPLAPITDPSTDKTISTADFPTYLQAIYRIGIAICFALGVIMFTWAGIEYIVSEAMGTKADAKKRMSSALIGLAIVLVSYILLNTINPDLLNLKPLNLNNTGSAAPTP